MSQNNSVAVRSILLRNVSRGCYTRVAYQVPWDRRPGTVLHSIQQTRNVPVVPVDRKLQPKGPIFKQEDEEVAL